MCNSDFGECRNSASTNPKYHITLLAEAGRIDHYYSRVKLSKEGEKRELTITSHMIVIPLPHESLDRFNDDYQRLQVFFDKAKAAERGLDSNDFSNAKPEPERMHGENTLTKPLLGDQDVVHSPKGVRFKDYQSQG